MAEFETALRKERQLEGITATSALRMTIVPLSLFVEDRINRRKVKAKQQASGGELWVRKWVRRVNLYPLML